MKRSAPLYNTSQLGRIFDISRTNLARKLKGAGFQGVELDGKKGLFYDIRKVGYLFADQFKPPPGTELAGKALITQGVKLLQAQVNELREEVERLKPGAPQ